MPTAADHLFSNPTLAASGCSKTRHSILGLESDFVSLPIWSAHETTSATHLRTPPVAAKPSASFHRSLSGAVPSRNPRQHKLEQHDTAPHIGQLIVPDTAYILTVRVLLMIPSRGPSTRGEYSWHPADHHWYADAAIHNSCTSAMIPTCAQELRCCQPAIAIWLFYRRALPQSPETDTSHHVVRIATAVGVGDSNCLCLPKPYKLQGANLLANGLRRHPDSRDGIGVPTDHLALYGQSTCAIVLAS